MASPVATRRSRLDLAARSLQPTQVRIGGTPVACWSARVAIATISLPCPDVAYTRRERHSRDRKPIVTRAAAMITGQEPPESGVSDP